MKIILTVYTFLAAFTSVVYAQSSDATNMLQVVVPDSISHPTIAIFHSMGDINVKGHTGNKLVVYAEEMLPSVSELAKKKTKEVFNYIDKQSNNLVTVNRNAKFMIQQMGNVYQVKTNILSMNCNVFVVTPKRASISVNSEDMGNITIEDVAGDVEANGNAGNIVLKNIDGSVSASTVHGNVIAQMMQENIHRPVFFSTFVGNIELVVQPHIKNTVILSSEMGNLYSNFDTMNKININVSSPNKKNRKLSFDINGGGTEFVLNTFKGDIYLRHF